MYALFSWNPDCEPEILNCPSPGVLKENGGPVESKSAGRSQSERAETTIEVTMTKSLLPPRAARTKAPRHSANPNISQIFPQDNDQTGCASSKRPVGRRRRVSVHEQSESWRLGWARGFYGLSLGIDHVGTSYDLREVRDGYEYGRIVWAQSATAPSVTGS
jgi:hypothetical protein